MQHDLSLESGGDKDEEALQQQYGDVEIHS